MFHSASSCSHQGIILGTILITISLCLFVGLFACDHVIMQSISVAITSNCVATVYMTACVTVYILCSRPAVSILHSLIVTMSSILNKIRLYFFMAGNDNY